MTTIKKINKKTSVGKQIYFDIIVNYKCNCGTFNIDINCIKEINAYNILQYIVDNKKLFINPGIYTIKLYKAAEKRMDNMTVESINFPYIHVWMNNDILTVSNIRVI